MARCGQSDAAAEDDSEVMLDLDETICASDRTEQDPASAGFLET